VVRKESQLSAVSNQRLILEGACMGKTILEKLEVYQLSEELADLIWEAVLGWDSLARNTVGRQIVRSADCVGANIAEGTGRGSFQDNRRFVYNSRGSLNETMHFLRRAYRRKLLSSRQVTEIKQVVDKLAPKLNAYLRSIGKVSPKQGNN
jgi:four helix bundle protein